MNIRYILTHLNYSRIPIFKDKHNHRSTIHNGILSELYLMAFKFGFIPQFEARINKKRYDMAWYKNNDRVLIFEIDMNNKITPRTNKKIKTYDGITYDRKIVFCAEKFNLNQTPKIELTDNCWVISF